MNWHLRALVVATVLVLTAACRSDAPSRRQAQAVEDATVAPVAVTDDAGVAAPSPASAIDRCLRPATPPWWERAQTHAAVAAAALVLDGDAAPPIVAPGPHRQQRQFESDFTLARAALAVGQDGAAALDRAFRAATAIAEDLPRDRALLWGAVALSESGHGDAARWAAAIGDADHRHELAAHQVRILAARGDLAGARAALAALPASWTSRADVEAWPGYPRWLGSVATTACVALTSPAAAASPQARALLEDAERAWQTIDEAWRQDADLQPLAMAWARLGAGDRALRTAARRAGAARAALLYRVLEATGERRWSARADLDPELATMIAQRALIEDVCGRLARRELAPQRMLETIPHGDGDVAAWIGLAYDVGCAPVAQALLHGARLGGRLADNQLEQLRSLGRLDDAIALLQWAWDRMTPVDRGDRLAALLDALVLAGRARDAAALLRGLPAHREPLVELRVLAAGHRLVVALAIAGDTTDAEALRAELRPRLARALGE